MTRQDLILALTLAGVALLPLLSCAGDGTTLDPLGNPIGPPKILVNPRNITVTLDRGETLDLTLKIKNGGGYPLVVTRVESQQAWIQIRSPAAEIELAPGDSVLLPVTLGQSSLEVGIFVGSIEILSNDEETPLFNLEITLEVSIEVLLFEPTLSNIQRFIFTTICIECHSGPRSPKGLRLGEATAFEMLVNVSSSEKPEYLRVEPFNPDDSYLVRKLEGGPDILGERMPLNRPPLSRDQIKVIRRWIANGAPNN